MIVVALAGALALVGELACASKSIEIQQETSDGGPGIWVDPYTGLSWQNPPADRQMTPEEARDYCDGLVIGEMFDWRLPDIDQLRSLVRGCPLTVPLERGGSCPVSASCTEEKCGIPSVCEWPCARQGGPGMHGEYWDAALSGTSFGYWSASSVPCMSENCRYMGPWTWAVFFDSGTVGFEGDQARLTVRCVHR